MIMKMAFRNIFRHKSRTFLTLITIIIAIFSAVFGDGFNRGMERQMIELSIDTDISTNKIYQEGYYDVKDEEDPLDYEIKNIEKIEEILSNKIYSKRIIFNGSVTDGKNELRIEYIGVKPEIENRVFNREDYIIRGDYFENREEIVVGTEISRLMNLDIGDYVTITGRTKEGSYNAYDKKIGGIIKTGNPLFDTTTILVNFDFAKEFTRVSRANDIAVFSEIDSSKKRELQELGTEVVNWNRELKDIRKMIEVRSKVFRIISLIILLMAGVGITNTMLMVMMERRKEIGIMKANGMDRSDILKLFLAEGTVIGFIGSGVGFLIGSFLVIYYQKFGIPMPDVQTIGVGFPFSDKLYSYYSLIPNIIYFLIGTFIAIFATLYPANKASKMNAIKAIKSN